MVLKALDISFSIAYQRTSIQFILYILQQFPKDVASFAQIKKESVCLVSKYLRFITRRSDFDRCNVRTDADHPAHPCSLISTIVTTSLESIKAKSYKQSFLACLHSRYGWSNTWVQTLWQGFSQRGL